MLLLLYIQHIVSRLLLRTLRLFRSSFHECLPCEVAENIRSASVLGVNKTLMHAHSIVCVLLSRVALLPKKRRTTWIVVTFLNSSTSLGVKYALSSRPSTSSGMTMALLLLPTVATAAQHNSTLATSAANATRVRRAVAPPCPNTRTISHVQHLSLSKPERATMTVSDQTEYGWHL